MLGKCSKNCNRGNIKKKKYGNFLIVGDGSLKNEVQQKTKELKLDNNIQFVVPKVMQNVYDYYKKLSSFYSCF